MRRSNEWQVIMVHGKSEVGVFPLCTSHIKPGEAEKDIKVEFGKKFSYHPDNILIEYSALCVQYIGRWKNEIRN